MMPWVKKYRPRLTSEVIGQDKPIHMLKQFAYNFPSKPKLSRTQLDLAKQDSLRKKAVILYGPSGCGKTVAVEALALEKNYELIEMNASTVRTAKQIEARLKPASQQMSLFGTNKIILLDEIDALSGHSDRGGAKAVAEVIKQTKFPIILTANDPWTPKLRTLRRYCEMIGFESLKQDSLTRVLMMICMRESIVFEEPALARIAASSGGDMRAAINDLQVLTSQKKRLRLEDVQSWGREQEESIFNALNLIFKSFDPQVAFSAIDDLPIESRDFGYWLDHNIPAQYLSASERRVAYRALSSADIFEQRIRSRQHWRFRLYSKLLMGAGVQQAKERVRKGFSRYQPPAMLQKIFIRAAKRKKAQGIAAQVSTDLHASAAVLQKSFIPYFNFIRENNPEMGKELDEFLGV